MYCILKLMDYRCKTFHKCETIGYTLHNRTPHANGSPLWKYDEPTIYPMRMVFRLKNLPPQMEAANCQIRENLLKTTN